MSIRSSSSDLSMRGQHNNGPPSNISSRPPSRTTSRTPLGPPRPTSSLSVRPVSSASARPSSRFSQRPHSRQARSRLIPFCQNLVKQATGLKENDPETEGVTFQEKVDYAVRRLETTTMVKAAATVDMGTIERQMNGHALKARINSKDALAKALEIAYKELKTHIEMRESDLDQEIKTVHIPDHLQFLLALSQPPTNVTEAKANTFLDAIANPPPPPITLSWADILAEEPFEGEHWEGIFPPGAALSTSLSNKGLENDWDSEPSLSPLDSDDLALDDESNSFLSAEYDESSGPLNRQPAEIESLGRDVRIASDRPFPFEHKKRLEVLQSRQYWRDDWHTDAPLTSRFDLGDPSTLGPTLNRALAQASGFQDAQAMLKPERYIHEEDMVREILMALQGIRNIVLKWSGGSFEVTPSTPRLIHLSLASQESIISSFAKISTTVEQLRRFTVAVFSKSISRTSTTSADNRTYIRKKTSITRTCEAFADAIDHAIRGLNSWCAAREEAICRAFNGVVEDSLVVSLLSTEKALRDEHGTSFEALLDIVQEVFRIKPDENIDASGSMLERSRQSPAAITTLLLNTVFTSVQQHIERRDTVTSDALMKVFVWTVEPIWATTGRWLRAGMGVAFGAEGGSLPGFSGLSDNQDDEFFIESSGIGCGMMGLGLLDPEFWNEGYALREISFRSLEDVSSVEGQSPASSQTKKVIPVFLENIADLILGTGKAVGLLRALNVSSIASAFNYWDTFAGLINSEDRSSDSLEDNNAGLFSVSIHSLSQLIYDSLRPKCQVIGERLVQVLVDDCAVWKHLEAIEDIYLLRKGDAMGHFIDAVFTKMDSQHTWSDFHFLNTAFNDIVHANADADTRDWINASLVRFSYRGSREKERSIGRTVRALDGLVLEYAVPFPLIYIFQPKILQLYNEIFVFLLQIRRAKSMLERILVRDEHGRSTRLREELKIFYAMRSRLSWFTNTLLNFLTTYVIHAEVFRFRQASLKVQSLDEMIQLHEDHLGKIQGRCLLKPNTAALHKAILSILDMCLHFSEGFITFAGDTTATLDVSRQSISMKRHRSSRQRRHQRNVIGFSQSLQDFDLSSGDEDEENAEIEVAVESSVSMLSSSMPYTEGDFFTRVEKMSSELDGLVRFLRRGVESLAGGASEAASAFGVFAFSLEDWDI